MLSASVLWLLACAGLNGLEASAASEPDGWRTVAAGRNHTCAIDDAGEMWCWGANREGQLGNGGTEASLIPSPVSADGETWLTVSAGHAHTCGVREDHSVWCWGRHGYGEDGRSTTPVSIDLGVSGIVSVESGRHHTCALVLDSNFRGSVHCWGFSPGQLRHETPWQVPAADGGAPWGDFVQIVSSGGHTCGRRAAAPNALWCWRVGAAPSKEELSGLTPHMLAAGQGNACVIGHENVPWCWSLGGHIHLHPIDHEIVFRHPEPAPPPKEEAFFGSEWGPLAVGNDHTCGLRNEDLYCWGHIRGRVLDDLHRAGVTYAPQRVPTQRSGWRALSAGLWHTCAIGTDESLHCWGYNGAGQLGDGTTEDRPVPVQVGVR